MKTVCTAFMVAALLSLSACKEDKVGDALNNRSGEKLRDAAEEVKEAAKESGDAIKDAASDVKDAVKDAAEDVKDAAVDAKEAVKDATK